MKKVCCFLFVLTLLAFTAVPALAGEVYAGNNAFPDPAPSETREGHIVQIIIIAVLIAVSVLILAAIIISELKRSK